MLQKYFRRNNMMLEAQASGGRNLPLEILLFFAVLFVGQIPQGIVTEIFMVVDLLRDHAFLQAVTSGDFEILTEYLKNISSVMSARTMLTQLFSTGIATAVTILYCRYFEKRRVSTMGFRKKNPVPEYGVGLAVGLAMFGTAIGICALTGTVTFSGATDDFSTGLLVLFFLGYIVQGMSEETLCRGFFFISIQRKSSVFVAMLANSLAFALLHLLNPGVTVLSLVNIFLFGVFMSLYVLRRGNLWGACAVHSMWNFVQGNLFGVRVSGTEVFCSPVSTVSSASGTLLNGGSFGLEGGLAVTIVLAVGIAILFFMKNNKAEAPVETVSA